MLHSTLSTFPSLLPRVCSLPFWTLPVLPAWCSCPQAVLQPESFSLAGPPWLFSRCYSHRLTPADTALWWWFSWGVTSSGRDWPFPILCPPPAVVCGWPEETHEGMHRAVGTEHSLHALISPDIVHRNNQCGRAWGRSRGHRSCGHSHRKAGWRRYQLPRGGCSSEDLPSLLFSVGFFSLFFPPLSSSQKVTLKVRSTVSHQLWVIAPDNNTLCRWPCFSILCATNVTLVRAF